MVEEPAPALVVTRHETQKTILDQTLRSKRQGGQCSARIYILGGLKDKLMAPDLIAEFVRSYQAEINNATKAAAVRNGELLREAEAVARKIAGIMVAVEDGMYTPALKERMAALEQRKAEIEGMLADAATPPVVRIHPNMAEIYRLKVAELEVALNDDNIKAEAGEVLRSLIDRVVLTPAAEAPNGIEAQLYGDLAAILQLSNGGDKQKLPAMGVVGSLLSVVAGEHNQRYLQCLVSRILLVNRRLALATGVGIPRKHKLIQ